MTYTLFFPGELHSELVRCAIPSLEVNSEFLLLPQFFIPLLTNYINTYLGP